MYKMGRDESYKMDLISSAFVNELRKYILEKTLDQT